MPDIVMARRGRAARRERLNCSVGSACSQTGGPRAVAAGRAWHREGLGGPPPRLSLPQQRLDRERLLSRVMRTGGCVQDLSTERRPGLAIASEAVMRAGTDLRRSGWRGRRAPLAGRLWR